MILLYILGGLLAALLLLILFLAVGALLVSPKKEYDTDSRFYRFWYNFAAATALKLMRVRVHVTGQEKLPQDQKILFVGNHRSNVDPIATGHGFKKWRISFISKPSLFKIPIFGRYIHRCCFLAIDRENPRNAITTIRKGAALLEKQEVSVGVYPEGTRSKTGALLPFHNGVFKIAQKAEVPIAVVCITGSEQVSERWPWRHTDVYVDVLEVFSAAGTKEAKTQDIGTAVCRLLEGHMEKREKDS